MGNPRLPPASSRLPDKPYFVFDGVKPSLDARLMASTMTKRFKNVCPTWPFLPQSPVSRHPLCQTVITVLKQKPHKLLELICVPITLSHQARSTKLTEDLDSNWTKTNYMALSDLISLIAIFMTFWVTCSWLLIFVFRCKREPLP